MSGNFSEAELRELIAERDDPLEFCSPGTVQAADPIRGIPERSQMVSRRVCGYVKEDRQAQFGLASQGSASGMMSGLIAVLLATDTSLSSDAVTREELNNGAARIRYEGKLYQFEYLKDHRDRGIVRLHEVRLTRSEKTP